MLKVDCDFISQSLNINGILKYLLNLKSCHTLSVKNGIKGCKRINMFDWIKADILRDSLIFFSFFESKMGFKDSIYQSQ